MNEERCVCCGAIIPEGKQICPNCENKGGKYLLDKAMPFWTMPTEMLEQLIHEIYELIVVVNYIPAWELSDKDCRKLTLILKEMLSALEEQMKYRKQIDGKA